MTSVEIGSEIDARCGKCRRVTTHVVVGKVDWKPTRVECTTCSAVHAFRPPPEPKAERAAAETATKRPQDLWKLLMQRTSGQARPYDPATDYELGNRVHHRRFGPGVVIRVASETVCEVAFETGTVKLRMRSGSTGARS